MHGQPISTHNRPHCAAFDCFLLHYTCVFLIIAYNEGTIRLPPKSRAYEDVRGDKLRSIL